MRTMVSFGDLVIRLDSIVAYRTVPSDDGTLIEIDNGYGIEVLKTKKHIDSVTETLSEAMLEIR